ncbi:MAG: hypothetical protein K0S47_1399 [Herbinix sp.]|nr:hypothetical protein [Herbinix sp.]
MNDQIDKEANKEVNKEADKEIEKVMDGIEQWPEVSPEDEQMNKSNPWHTPISYITWGFILTTLTLNFLLLQYIIPTLGVVLLSLGFRSLKKENHCFYIAWVLVTIKMIWHAMYLIASATPIVTYIKSNILIEMIAVTLQFVLITIFAYTPFANFWPVSIPMILIYLIIIRSLYKLGNELKDIAFVSNDSERAKGIGIIWGYVLSCIILVSIGCISSNHLKVMETEHVMVSESETREKLKQMDFPEDILLDLSDRDVAKLTEAIHIETSSELLSFDPVKVTTQSRSNAYIVSNKPGDCNLKVSTIFIEFPENLLYVIVHFNWMENKAYWQDGFTIWGEDGFALLNGVLLYEKQGIEYSAPILRLKCEELTSYGWFGTNSSQQISGAVSYPFLSEHQRGYVFYRIQLPKEQLLGCNCFNYIHYIQPFQYPYVKTEDRILNGNYPGDSMRQHYTNFELQTYRNIDN